MINLTNMTEGWIFDNIICRVRFQNCWSKSIKLCKKVSSSTYSGRHLNSRRYTHLYSSVRLKKGIKWHKAPTKEEMLASFINLWQSALEKCFVNKCSSIKCLITNGKKLGSWTDQNTNNKWTWWSVPNESRIYRRNNGNWFFNNKFHRRFYYNNEAETLPMRCRPK